MFTSTSPSPQSSPIKGEEGNGFRLIPPSLLGGGLFKASSSKENTDPQYILALVAIIFELLGGIPYYGDRSKLNKKNDFSLNALRTIHYLQDDYQKACTIMKASGSKIKDVYMFNYHDKPKEFIKWYKEKYPKEYLEIF
jgi:hypothetical protein